MKVLDLFSGIGGFSLGLERAGMETVAFCEYDKHAQKVLRKLWPDVPIFEDVRQLDGHQFKGTVDVVCGGFPCQDLSLAGKKSGFEGDRSNLYREMLRIISECRPSYAIFENVTGLLTGESGRWFAKFLYDLAAIGFDAEWHCISASYIGAPHHRDRVWIIAYPKGIKGRRGEHTRMASNTMPGFKKERLSANSKIMHGNGSKTDTKNGRAQTQEPRSGSCTTDIPNPTGERCERFAKIADSLKQQIELMRSSEAVRDGFSLSEPPLCGTNDGVSGRLHRLKQLGNSVVPQIPEAIGRAILNRSTP